MLFLMISKAYLFMTHIFPWDDYLICINSRWPTKEQIYKYRYSLSEQYSQRFQNKYCAHRYGAARNKSQGQTMVKKQIFRNSNFIIY